jgi:hypothetical protein
MLMTDKKDDPAKSAPSPTPSAKPGDSKSGDGKRPHATIDLRAVEVPSKPTEAVKTAQQSSSGSALPSAAAASAASASDKSADSKLSNAKPTEPNAGKTSADAKPQAAKANDKPAFAPQPRLERSGSGLGSTLTHLLAGVVGGGMAWYGATTLGPQYGLVPPVSDPKMATLEQRLAGVEKSASDRASAASGDLATKLAAVQSQLSKVDAVGKSVADLTAAQAKIASDAKSLSEKIAAQNGNDGPAARLAKLEDQLKLMSQAAATDPQSGKLPQIAALSGRVVDMETTLNNQLSALRKTVSQELEQRLSLTNETSEAAKSGTNRIDRDLAAVKSQAAANSEKLDKIRSDAERLATAVQGIRDDSNGLKTALDAVKSDTDAKFKAAAKPADVATAMAPMASKLTNLEQSVQNVVRNEDDRKSSSERILLSLELNNLKRVIDRGQKYATELADVQKAAGGKVDLAVLERYKDSGIATLADLARDFGPVSNAIIEAQADAGDGSVVSRVLASAKSVISVRKITYKPDDTSAEAVVGRMDAALKDGNLPAVLEESKKIPAKSAGAAHDWLVKVEARGAVDRAIASLEAGLKTSLTGAAPVVAPPSKP